MNRTRASLSSILLLTCAYTAPAYADQNCEASTGYSETVLTVDRDLGALENYFRNYRRGSQAPCSVAELSNREFADMVAGTYISDVPGSNRPHTQILTSDGTWLSHTWSDDASANGLDNSPRIGNWARVDEDTFDVRVVVAYRNDGTTDDAQIALSDGRCTVSSLEFDNIPCDFRIDPTADPADARESLWAGECAGPTCISGGALNLRKLSVPTTAR